MIMSVKTTREELEQQILKLEQVVSEYKQAVKAAQKSEKRLAALSVASFEAIFLSEKGVCIDQNQAAERIFGYTRTEAVGRQAMEWIAPKDRELVKDKMLSGCEEAYEVTALCKDGKTFPTEIQAKMIIFRGQNVRVTALRDITGRKQAEKALSRSEKKYRSLANNLNVGIYRNTIGSNGRIIEANPAMVEMFGFDNREELLKMSVSDLYKNPDDREAYKAKILKTGAARNIELQLQKKDNTSFIASISAVAAKDENGDVKYFDGVIEDITDRKQAAAVLQKSKETLARSKKNGVSGTFGRWCCPRLE
jgi:PAS domain S-box-containing protein